MKRLLRKLILSALLGCLCVWCAAVVRCEWLTAKYADPAMISACREAWPTDGYKKFKVLDYERDGYARIYAVDAFVGYEFVLLADWNADGEPIWKVDCWEAVWAKQGSADGFIWPYFR